jgi:hypothetical protein
MKEDILADIEKFLSEKEISWYAARGGMTFSPKLTKTDSR